MGGAHTAGRLAVLPGTLALAESPRTLCPSSLPDSTHGHVFPLSVGRRVTKVRSATSSDSARPPCARRQTGPSLVLVGGSDGVLLAALLLPLPKLHSCTLSSSPQCRKQCKRSLGGLANLYAWNSALTSPGPVLPPVSVSVLHRTQPKTRVPIIMHPLGEEILTLSMTSSNPSSQHLFLFCLPQMYAPMPQRPALGASHYCPPRPVTTHYTCFVPSQPSGISQGFRKELMVPSKG